MMAGPALGGVLIGGLGLDERVRRRRRAPTSSRSLVFVGHGARRRRSTGASRASTTSVLDGLRFLRGHSVIMSVFAIDLLAMVFGMPRALFPALAERLGGGPALYGLLLSSVAAGAFVASLLSGWTTRVRAPGPRRAVRRSRCGASRSRSPASPATPGRRWRCSCCAGGADMISGVYRSAIAADVTPDELRGRVSGVELAVYAGGPVLGDVEAGVVGGLVERAVRDRVGRRGVRRRGRDCSRCSCRASPATSAERLESGGRAGPGSALWVPCCSHEALAGFVFQGGLLTFRAVKVSLSVRLWVSGRVGSKVPCPRGLRSVVPLFPA